MLRGKESLLRTRSVFLIICQENFRDALEGHSEPRVKLQSPKNQQKTDAMVGFFLVAGTQRNPNLGNIKIPLLYRFYLGITKFNNLLFL